MLLKGAEWRLAVQVTAPRGAGHVVAIASTQMPPALLDQLKRLEGQPGGAAAASQVLVSMAVERQVQLGVLGFFS
jgi:hypothetical protein